MNGESVGEISNKLSERFNKMEKEILEKDLNEFLESLLINGIICLK